VQLAVVQAGTDGSFGYLTTPQLYTTYTASMQASTGTIQSSPVIAQVAPKVQLVPGRSGWMHAQVPRGSRSGTGTSSCSGARRSGSG
jgi:hypothetical protein